MTMHMVHPGLSTLNTDRKKKKPSQAQIRAQQEHDAWLRKNNVHIDQLSSRIKKPGKLRMSYKTSDNTAPCSNGFANGGAKKSIFNGHWQDQYQHDPVMAEREKIALARAEALKARVLPLYNKGGLQLMPEGLKFTELGKRRP
jgi:hypothetical protein